MFPFTWGYLLSITCRTWTCFSRKIFSVFDHITQEYDFNFFESLKSLYEGLWSPVIFEEPKFSKTFIKILIVFSLFITVKKTNIFTISLKYLNKIFKNIFLLLKTFRDLWRSLWRSKYFQTWENKENMQKYTKKPLQCMFQLYFWSWKKILVNVSSLTDVCKSTTSRINTQQLYSYKNMIQAWLKSHCIVLNLYSICIFLAEK